MIIFLFFVPHCFSLHITSHYSSPIISITSFISHYFFFSPVYLLPIISFCLSSLPSSLIISFCPSSLFFISHHSFSSPITPLFLFVSYHSFSSPITLFHLPLCPISPFCFLSLLITLFYSLSSSITFHYSIVISFFY
ncbi:hypothetical protein C1646_707277 [Rhizophagus diaphanus]|nr:hypothetical protein C1646_707277 [Rhizophagus diaphanus] [Rhizophagus sp. MUCL 43196]